jgi:hypothetical protein
MNELKTKAVITALSKAYMTLIVFNLEIERKIYFKEYKSIKTSSIEGNKKNILSLELIQDRNYDKPKNLKYEVSLE